jgi:hypothetical protein
VSQVAQVGRMRYGMDSGMSQTLRAGRKGKKKQVKQGPRSLTRLSLSCLPFMVSAQLHRTTLRKRLIILDVSSGDRVARWTHAPWSLASDTKAVRERERAVVSACAAMFALADVVDAGLWWSGVSSLTKVEQPLLNEHAGHRTQVVRGGQRES